MKISKEKLIQMIKESVGRHGWDKDSEGYTPYQDPGNPMGLKGAHKSKPGKVYKLPELSRDDKVLMDAEEMYFTRGEYSSNTNEGIIALATDYGMTEQEVVNILINDGNPAFEDIIASWKALNPMAEHRRITKSRLREIIKEEVVKILNEE
jgi:DNA-binding phage protein